MYSTPYLGALTWAGDWIQARALDYGPPALALALRELRAARAEYADAFRAAGEGIRAAAALGLEALRPAGRGIAWAFRDLLAALRPDAPMSSEPRLPDPPWQLDRAALRAALAALPEEEPRPAPARAGQEERRPRFSLAQIAAAFDVPESLLSGPPSPANRERWD